MTREMIVEALKAKGYTAKKKNVVKNGIECKGIMIGDPRRGAALVYTDQLLQFAENKQMSLEEITGEFIDIYKHSGGVKIDVRQLLDREFLLAHMYIGLQRKGSEKLVKRSVKQLDGLESYLYIRAWEEEEESAMTKVIAKMLQICGITEDEAWERAESNTFAESIMLPVAGICENVVPMEQRDNVPMYMVTNYNVKYGASAILNKKKLREFGKKYHTDKIVMLPSSIHEVLIFPYDEEVDLNYYTALVNEVNEEVSPLQQLADKAYLLTI